MSRDRSVRAAGRRRPGIARHVLLAAVVASVALGSVKPVAIARAGVLEPDIDVTKTADLSVVDAGQQVGFRVTITNSGLGAATGLTVSDDLPDGLTWSIVAADSDLGWSITGSGDLAYAPSTLAGNSSTTVHVVATTDTADCGSLANTVTVNAANDAAAADSATASITVRCSAIDVTKVADAAAVDAGQVVGFTVTLSNTGSGTATGLVFSDPLPAGFTWSIVAADSDAGWSISSGNLVYAPSTLAGNSDSTVHVIALSDVGDCGSVSNTATLDAANDDLESATATVTVRCSAIDVTKVADAAAVDAGQVVGFTVTLSNTGSGTATGLVFSDPLPAGFTWSIVAADSDAGWSISSGNLVYAPSTLAGNSDSTVHVIALSDVGDCGSVSNTATLDAANDDLESATASITVRCSAIDVTKVADAAAVDAGQVVGFTVTLSNTGSGTATGLVFSDPLPAGFTWSIVAADSDAGWSISSGNLVYAPSTLAGNSDSTVHVIALSDVGDCGSVSNTATLDAANDDLESATATVTVRCSAIDVTKVADAAAVDAGQVVGFTVTLSNTGSGTATGLVFSDPLPAGFTWSIVAADSDAGWSISSGNLVYAPSTLAGNSDSTVHVIALSDVGDCGSVSNTATLDAANDDLESATASITVRCSAIDVTKVADAAAVDAGQVVGFTVTLSNTGSGTATGLVFSDPLPAGFTWSIVAADSDAGWSISSGNLVYAPSTLAGNSDSTVHVIALSDVGDCGSVSNTATLDAANDDLESATATVTVRCSAIDVTKVADAAAVDAGQVVGFTVTLSNTGSGTATGLVFSDPLPAGFTWSIVAADSDAGWSISSGNLVYAPSTLAGNSDSTVHVIALSDVGDCGSVSNTATLDAANDDLESATATVTVRCPDAEAQITPTGTTCQQYAAGTAADLTVLTYSTKRGSIRQVSPGVFFYWFQVMAVPGLTVLAIDQEVTTNNFAGTFDQASGSGVFATGCSKVAGASISTSDGQTLISFVAPSAGEYIVGVKYSASSLVGDVAPTAGTHGDFSVDWRLTLSGPGIQPGTSDSLRLLRK